jgi:hypothetical protein
VHALSCNARRCLEGSAWPPGHDVHEMHSHMSHAVRCKAACLAGMSYQLLDTIITSTLCPIHTLKYPLQRVDVHQ